MADEKRAFVTIYYFWHINAIGGIESFFYYLAKKYHTTKDLTIIYRTADDLQLQRLKQYVRCIKWDGKEEFKCKQLFCNFNTDIMDYVEAEEYNIVLHGDYKDMVERNQINGPPMHEKATRYIGVSELVSKNFSEITGGTPCITSYNPIEIERKQPPILKFISATRLSSEKGLARMQKLVELFDFPFIWLVFTNDANFIAHPHVLTLPPTLEVLPYVQEADALIQLSDNEGFCLSVVESLMLGTPVIVTDLPVFKELGLNDTNSIRLNHEMTNIPLDRIRNIRNLKGFSYNPPKDGWDDLLISHTSDYVKEVPVKVKATNMYEKLGVMDAVEGKILPEGYEFEVTSERLDVLTGNNSYGVAFVTLIVEPAKELEEKLVDTVLEEDVPITEAKPKKRGRKAKNGKE